MAEIYRFDDKSAVQTKLDYNFEDPRVEGKSHDEVIEGIGQRMSKTEADQTFRLREDDVGGNIFYDVIQKFRGRLNDNMRRILEQIGEEMANPRKLTEFEILRLKALEGDHFMEFRGKKFNVTVSSQTLENNKEPTFIILNVTEKDSLNNERESFVMRYFPGRIPTETFVDGGTLDEAKEFLNKAVIL